MNRDVFMWYLAAVAAIAVAAVLVLFVRNRALEAKQRRAGDLLTRQLEEAESRWYASEAELKKFTDGLDETIRQAEEAAEESTKAAVKGATRYLQSLAVEQMALLEGIQRKYGGHAVLGDLLEVNHANAQMARKAQGIAVLCGAPVGRRNRPASVYDVVRSAQGQIRNFNRVQIMEETGFTLKASAVSPVALAVAELLDNAAAFSQPGDPIEVTFRRAQRKLCIIIDDAGVGMTDEEREKATKLLSGDSDHRLSQLGSQPKFGLAVVGQLARHYGFGVDVTGVSRYGSVRAVVLLPEGLWTEEQAPTQAEVAPVRRGRRAEDQAAKATRTVHGLPKRGARQAPIASVSGSEDSGPASQTPEEARRASGRSLGALQRGTLSARRLDSPSIEGSEDI